MIRILPWSLMLCALACMPVRAAVVDAAANGFTVENTREVPVDAATAWKALVEDVDRWWPKDHTWWGKASRLSIDPHAGGCFCERRLDNRGEALHMTVAFVDPGKLLRMTGGLGPLQGMGLTGALEWRFVENDGKTRITLWYRAGGYTPDGVQAFAPVVDQVMAGQLDGLAVLLGAAAPAGTDQR